MSTFVIVSSGIARKRAGSALTSDWHAVATQAGEDRYPTLQITAREFVTLISSLPLEFVRRIASSTLGAFSCSRRYFEVY